MEATHNPPPEPGHFDALRPSQERLDDAKTQVAKGEPVVQDEANVGTQASMLRQDGAGRAKFDGKGKASPAPSINQSVKDGDVDGLDIFEPRPPKVLMDDPDAVPLELREQIQMYSTNECVVIFSSTNCVTDDIQATNASTCLASPSRLFG